MSQRSVLIIDDDQALVAALKEGLEEMGCRVAVAYDGLQGILQAHQEKPTIIMLDFNMPAGGGAGVYERLRGSADTARIPIVFLTAVTVDEVRSNIRTTQNTFFLKKPVSVGQLRKVMDKVLGGVPPSPAPAPAGGAAAPPPAPAASPETAGGPALSGPFAGLVGGAPRGGPNAGEAAAPPAPGGTARWHEFELRVGYGDTDRLGIIYYANYLRYFELGRSELLRSIGMRYRDLENDRKIFMPVAEARCEYLKPSRYDELLAVRTCLSWMGRASVCFQNEIFSKDEGGALAARGFTRHAILGEDWRPRRLPPDLRDLLKSIL